MVISVLRENDRNAFLPILVFDEAFMKAVSSKTKGLMFHLREYLLTEKAHQREFILQVSIVIPDLLYT